MRLEGKTAVVGIDTLGESAVFLGIAKLGARKIGSWRLEIEEARTVARILLQAADAAEGEAKP
jgi:hypothetical protein